MRMLGKVALAGIAGALALCQPAFADEPKKGSTWDSWYNASLQWAYSWDAGNDFIIGYGSEEKDRHQIRLEFENIWKYGETYLYADILHSSGVIGGNNLNFGFPCCGDGKKTEGYGLINANLSAQKVFGLQRGLFDVALEGRLEYGTFFDYSAYAIGASLYLNLPYFVQRPGDKIQFTYWHRWNRDDFVTQVMGLDRYADHNLWGITLRKEWEMMGLRWAHQTFFRYQQSEDGGPNELKRHPRIFWEAELFAYLNNNVQVGFRSEYFWDNGGIDFGGVKDHWRPMVAVKVDFARSD